MKFINAKNPRWASIEKNSINLEVEFENLGWVPYLAVYNDCVPHGVEIFERAKANEFGTVSEFIEPIQQITTESERKKRDELLIQIDQLSPVYWASISEIKKGEWVKYRQDLLDVPQQTGFPQNILWPTMPSR